jgi:GMP synthase (glutamine-hydrolysing)
VNGDILNLGRPVLGICYGHQLLARMLDCDVESGNPEFGSTELQVSSPGELFAGTPQIQTVWMSHGDSVSRLATGIRKLASTRDCGIAAFECPARRIFGVQFHPEVVHTQFGRDLLNNFSRKICGITTQESVRDLVERLSMQIREKVGESSVFFFVSGGVDSTVAFALCAKALPRDRVLGVYVDTGLMRKNETLELRQLLGTLGLDDRLEILDESERFLSHLENVVDPEEKRRIIGRLFVEVQSDAMRKLGIDAQHWLLGQGTIYPDTIESGGAAHATALIKTHHNRCDEIRALMAAGKVIEPLSEFYKDEVRQIGVQLGLDQRITSRWPFPGPGLAIRCLCWDGREEVAETLTLPRGFARYHGARFPIKTVGVQGDDRTYRQVAALRGPLEYSALRRIGTELCNSRRDVNRVIVLVAGDGNRLATARVQPKGMTRERISLLRDADFIVRTTMDESGLTGSVWQFPTVLIPISFGHGESIVLRPVNSEDGMTANFAQVPVELLQRMAGAIMELPGIDAVFLDVTNKPPATIEWE